MNTIYDLMAANPELRPFIPAVHILEERLAGIEQHFPELALVLRCPDTEEEMISLLLRQPFLNFAILDSNKNAWCPSMRTFADFSSKGGTLKLELDMRPGAKRQQFFNWIIALCDWDGRYQLSAHSSH